MFYVYNHHKTWWDAKVVTIRDFFEDSVDGVIEVCERIHEWASNLLDQHSGSNGGDSEDGESGGHHGEDPPDNVPLADLNQDGNNHRLSTIREEEGGGPAAQDDNNEAPGVEEPPPAYNEVVNPEDNLNNNNNEEGEEPELGDMPPEAYDFAGLYLPASAPQLPSGPGWFVLLVCLQLTILARLLFTGFGMARSLPDMTVPDGTLVPLSHTGSGSLLLPISSTTMASYHDVHRQPGHRRLLDAGHTPAGSRRGSLALSTPTMGSSWASSLDTAASMATTLATRGRQVSEDLAAGWRALGAIQNVNN